MPPDKKKKKIEVSAIGGDPRKESASIEGVEGGGPLLYDKIANTIKAHETAVQAGGFMKHGANANPVKKGSSAKAPHDTDGM